MSEHPVTVGSAEWETLKSSLTQHADLLRGFETPALTQAIARITPNHDRLPPPLFASHLSAALRLEDRVRSLMESAFSLEVSAVSAAADFDLTASRIGVSRALELNRLGASRHDTASTAFEAAADAAGDGSADGLYYRALAQRSATMAREAADLEPMVEAQFAAERQFQTRFQGRHVVPGHAHNYVERHEQVIALLAEAIEDLIEKSTAAWRGATMAFEFDYPEPPQITDSASIHAFMLWQRKLAREVEARGKRQSGMRIAISINQASAIYDRLMTWQDFDDARNRIWEGDGPAEVFFRFEVDLSPAFRNVTAVRLESFGLALSLDTDKLDAEDRSLDDVAKLRAMVWVKPPIIKRPGHPDYDPNWFLMGDVAPFGRTVPLAVFSGAGITNLDPRGMWKILVFDRLISTGLNAEMRLSGHPDILTDIKIFPKVMADV